MNTESTIHVTLQVRNIVARDYDDAKWEAFILLERSDETAKIMLKMDVLDQGHFNEACRVAKECDGTYTVTIP
jgi:hypothetical protein